MAGGVAVESTVAYDGWIGWIFVIHPEIYLWSEGCSGAWFSAYIPQIPGNSNIPLFKYRIQGSHCSKKKRE